MQFSYIMKACVKSKTPTGGFEYIIPASVFDMLIKAAIRLVYFDENFYLETYPDVRQAIASGACGGAKEHFEQYGYFENRMPYNIRLDEKFYLESNPDVNAAVASGALKTAESHFRTRGYGEGRLPSPKFSLFSLTKEQSDQT